MSRVERPPPRSTCPIQSASPSPTPKPAAPKPTPTAAVWLPHLPTMSPIGREAETLASEPVEQGGAGAPAEAVEPDVDPTPSVGMDGEPATVGSYPPHYKPAAVTVLGRGIPPPPPPTALVGRHMTVYGAGLPGIDGESGHVTEYDPSSERYVPRPAQQRSRVPPRFASPAADASAGGSNSAASDAEAPATCDGDAQIQAPTGLLRPSQTGCGST